MGENYGVLINGKHTGRDYHLEWVAPFTIEVPKAKRCYVEVPFSNGILDFTSFLTGDDVKYENRDIQFHFSYDGDYTKWDIISERIKNELHGQMCSVIPDTRPDFVYYGIITIESEKDTFEESCDIVLSVDAEPYKYERYGSTEPWIWDTFCFEGGIIRNYKNLKVDGTMMLMIPGRRKKVIPVFECSDRMELTYKEKSYTIPAGRSRIPDLRLGSGEHFLIFTGTGTVSVNYRGGCL